MSTETPPPPQPSSSQVPAGWHPDPHDPSSQRYWDGTRWTEHRAPLSPAMQSAGTSPAVVVIAAAAIAGLIGAFGPWATAGVFSRSGIDGDGGITAAISGVLIVSVLFRLKEPTRGLAIWAMIAGALLAIVGIVDITDIHNRISGNRLAEAIGGVGWGLYLTVGAGAFAIIGGIALLNERRRP